MSEEAVSNLRFLEFMGVLDDDSRFNEMLKLYLRFEKDKEDDERTKGYLRELETYVNPALFKEVMETEEKMKKERFAESSDLVSSANQIRPTVSTLKATNDILNKLMGTMDNSRVERGV